MPASRAARCDARVDPHDGVAEREGDPDDAVGVHGHVARPEDRRGRLARLGRVVRRPAGQEEVLRRGAAQGAGVRAQAHDLVAVGERHPQVAVLVERLVQRLDRAEAELEALLPRAAVEGDRHAGLIAADRVADPQRERAVGRRHVHDLRAVHVRGQGDDRVPVGLQPVRLERSPVQDTRGLDGRLVRELADLDLALDPVEVRERELHRRPRREAQLALRDGGLGVGERHAHVPAGGKRSDRQRVARPHLGDEVGERRGVRGVVEALEDLRRGRVGPDLALRWHHRVRLTRIHRRNRDLRERLVAGLEVRIEDRRR